MRKLLLSFSFVFLLCLFSNPVFAQQGCCSHHLGVAGCDSSTGRKICNDGTLSPSCVCFGGGGLPPRQPSAPRFPQMSGSSSFTYNTNGTEDVKFELIDSNPTQYSYTLNKYPGVDPGPLVDSAIPTFYFRNVVPGKWYLNVKKDINHIWSTVGYWEIDVPAWVNPTPSIVPTVVPVPTIVDSNPIDNTISLVMVFFVLSAGVVIYLLGKEFIRKT